MSDLTLLIKRNATLILLITCCQLSAQKRGNSGETTNDTVVDTVWSPGKNRVEYSGVAFHTVFNIPLVRYNLNSFSHDPIGNLEYFNSVGAGISFSYGKISMKTRDDSSLQQNSSLFEDNLEISMKNVLGIGLGFLISKNDSVGGNRQMFAPVLTLQGLDFQLGVGYELGTVSNTAHRWFFTLSYGIPLSKFTKGGSYLMSNPKQPEGLKNNYKGLF